MTVQERTIEKRAHSEIHIEITITIIISKIKFAKIFNSHYQQKGLPMERVNTLTHSYTQLYFPLTKYGYILTKILNNENRWYTKVVCNILGEDFKHYASTTYARQNDYLRLLETTTYLECNNKLSPKITKIYPSDKTVVCDYIGEFLSDCLLNKPGDISLIITSVFDYLKDMNSINSTCKRFTIPLIIKETFQLSDTLADDFVFLPRIRTILPRLQDSDIKFIYGCGIEDPHIWNFRIVQNQNKIQALTTDFDYFSSRVNYFWELGYFYATFRWFKKISYPLAWKAKEILLSLVKNQDIKSEFMFWLGVLSSYCGYRDSLLKFMKNGEITISQEQQQLIQQLDEHVFYLVSKLLLEEKHPHLFMEAYSKPQNNPYGAVNTACFSF